MKEITAEWVRKAEVVAARYPGITITLEMAEGALAAASRVRAFIRSKLGL